MNDALSRELIDEIKKHRAILDRRLRNEEKLLCEISRIRSQLDTLVKLNERHYLAVEGHLSDIAAFDLSKISITAVAGGESDAIHIQS